MSNTSGFTPFPGLLPASITTRFPAASAAVFPRELTVAAAGEGLRIAPTDYADFGPAR
jgi:hypothetical protein